jgi:hypothetical protein
MNSLSNQAKLLCAKFYDAAVLPVKLIPQGVRNWQSSNIDDDQDFLMPIGVACLFLGSIASATGFGAATAIVYAGIAACTNAYQIAQARKDGVDREGYLAEIYPNAAKFKKNLSM